VIRYSSYNSQLL